MAGTIRALACTAALVSAASAVLTPHNRHSIASTGCSSGGELLHLRGSEFACRLGYAAASSSGLSGSSTGVSALLR
jgi:hypothetical protein